MTSSSATATQRSGSCRGHVFSVDVEEYFQVNAFEGIVPRSRWAEYPSRAEASLDRLLRILDHAGASGTFFVLGWLAERQPRLVRAIVEAGHEIASHGFWHRRVTSMDSEAFRADVRDAKALLEDLSGHSVVGFRAPSFSILPGMEWALDILLQEGYRYDSSRFPILRPGYGAPGTPRRPHHINRKAGRILELPLCTWKVGPLILPSAGGAYLRQFPFTLIRRGFEQAEKEGNVGMFYIHPWELDPEQPRLPVSALTRLRHYRGLSWTEKALRRLLQEFRFSSVADLFPSVSSSSNREAE